MKILKILAIALGSFLAVAIAAAVIVVLHFDADFIKAEAAREVKEKKQRTLKIDGPLELSFWPSLGVRAGKVSLSEHRSEREFLAIESVRVSVAVMPLIRRQVVVDALDIDGVNVTIVRRKDGTLNIDDLIGKDSDAKTPAMALDIAGVRLENGKIVFRDGQAGRDVDLSDVSLRTGRIAPGADLSAKLKVGQMRFDDKMIECKGSALFDLSTRGATPAAMKKALAGTASISLRDGAIKGINLAQSLRDLKGASTGKSERTDFSEMTAGFRIANGVAHNEDLAASSPFLRLSGGGDIDIGNGRMDYLLKASLVATVEGQGGKARDALVGVTVPVRLSGPFDDLSWKIEFADLVEKALKTKVVDKIEKKRREIVGQAQDKLLKGLFGR